jgi:hypothetical protein
MRRSILSSVALLGLLSACAKQTVASWPESAKKWFDRASYAYAHGDLEDAANSADQALVALPAESKVRLLGARVALASLDFRRALELTAGLESAEAAAIRGRAHWYLGEVDLAAEQLELAILDPDTKDPWAEQVAELARQGRGRRPFEVSGALLAVTEMPRVGTTSMVVPIELNGEPTLALIATDMAEAVIDTRQAGSGAWVSVRFGNRFEVSDIPAIGRDLSGLSKQIGAPVKMLIGVNLLRQLRATIDFSGSQFVVRSFEPPPPPEGTMVVPIFYRGGAMVLPGAFGTDQGAPHSSLLLNTSMTFPVALDEGGWKKAGQDPKTFPAVPGQAGIMHGMVPLLRLGAFEIPNIPGVYGPKLDELEKALDVDLDGFAGSGLFATFRLTFADGGRSLYIEDLPAEVIEARMRTAEALRQAAQQRRTMPDLRLEQPGVLEGDGTGTTEPAPAGGKSPPPPIPPGGGSSSGGGASGNVPRGGSAGAKTP